MLRGLTREHLDRIHRFVRLWRTLQLARARARPGARGRATGRPQSLLGPWGVAPAPLAYQAVARNAWPLCGGDRHLVGGARHAGLCRTHTRGPPEIRPLYDRLFLNAARSRTARPTSSASTLTRTELAASMSEISAKAAQISAALGTRQDDLQALIAAAPARPPQGAG